MKVITIILFVIFSILPISLYSIDHTSLYNRAISLAQDGDYESSLAILEDIEEYAMINEEYEQQFTIQIARGVVYRRMSEFDKSLNEYKNAQILYKVEDLDDPERLISLYQNYAVLNSMLGNDVAEVEYYKKAIEVAEEIGDNYLLVTNKIYLTKKNIDMGNVKNSIKKLLDINKFIDDELPNYDKRHLFNNLVYVYLELGNLEEAIKYLDELNLIENISEDYDVFIPSKINQALIKQREGNTEGALDILDKTEKSCENIFYKNRLIIEKSGIYASVGDFELAKKGLKSAETYFKSISNTQYQIEIINIKSQYLKLLDMNDIAYYNKMQDSIIKADKATLLESITINDELKDAIKTIEAESRYKSIVITVGIAILFVLLSSVLALNRQLKVKRMDEENFDLTFSINDIFFIFDKYFGSNLAKLQRYLVINKEMDRDELLEICNEMTINAFKLKEKEDEHISK